MQKTVDRLGPFLIVQGDIEGVTRFWVERAGTRLSGYGSLEDAREHAGLLYDEYVEDAEIDTGE